MATGFVEEDKLQDFIKNFNLELVRCANYGTENFIQLSGEDLRPAIDFATTHGKKILFYNYLYLEEEKYLLDEDEFLDNFDKVPNIVNEYNEKVRKIDFSQPFVLELFCLHEGHKIGISLQNMELSEKVSLLEEEDVDEIKRQITELREEMLEAKKELRHGLYNELMEKILNDPSFADKKNEPLRKEYIDSILEKPENEKYLELFNYNSEHMYWSRKDFIKLAWSKYREGTK